MKRKVLRAAGLLFLILFLLVAVLLLPPLWKGYRLYRTALNEKSIPDAIAEVKASEFYLPLEEIGTEFVTQLLETEDKRFYTHPGIDVRRIVRAGFKNLESGASVQGASTLTQQLARNLYFTFEKNYERKIAEIFMAFALEKACEKDEILELYCNVVNFGENCFGIRAAALHYFNVEPKSLSESQAAALVFTLKSPGHYNPNAIAKIPIA